MSARSRPSFSADFRLICVATRLFFRRALHRVTHPLLRLDADPSPECRAAYSYSSIRLLPFVSRAGTTEFSLHDLRIQRHALLCILPRVLMPSGLTKEEDA
jgi:hypothetical protein